LNLHYASSFKFSYLNGIHSFLGCTGSNNFQFYSLRGFSNLFLIASHFRGQKLIFYFHDIVFIKFKKEQEMINLKCKSQEILLFELKNMVSEERKLLIQVLRYLREIQDRKVYLDLAYPSMFEFCVKYLGYSEGAAQRRISAMRLIKEIPEVEEKVESGKLHLMALSQASQFFNQFEEVRESKLEILESLENKSKRQCELELLKLVPDHQKQEFIIKSKKEERSLTQDLTEIRVVINRELKVKLEKIMQLRSHKNPKSSYAELLEDLADMALKQLDKKLLPQMLVPPPVAVEKSDYLRSRYIPLKIKKFVWQRDKEQCQFRDPKTNRQCSSKHFIQVDHIKPYSYGGSSTDPNNLRLLCGQHNRYRYSQRNFEN
jgi:hypothetical protein